ncbi:short-chain oxidoreductase [Gammaproteobacteria bacterium 45_16_T64]|nr:short-chain oxidoreductase [Gammaproteobacteria bacterium 45_16_T64]
MSQLARQVADNASFQAFMNCYLREIDSGVWHPASHWMLQTGVYFNNNEPFVLEIRLTNSDITLAIGVEYRSLVGRHTLTHVFQQQGKHFDWQPIDYLSVQMLVVGNIYEQSTAIKSQQLELLSRLIESHQVMSRYVENRYDDPRLHSAKFIDSEQSILFGHWLHPTPKSRQGIHEWQHQDYAPELGGQFQLHYFAVDRTLVKQGSILLKSAEDIVLDSISTGKSSLPPQLSEVDLNKYVLIPAHPLQAHWLLLQSHIRELLTTQSILDIGLLGPKFTPTSSVRTLFCADLPYMFKLSIPVKITNSLRINMRHELDAGVVVASLLRKTEFSHEFTEFQTIDDPAFITLELPGKEESGFELIMRENPFILNGNTKENSNIHSVAAIAQSPVELDGQSRLAKLIKGIATEEDNTIKAVSLRWFDCYWQCAIAPAITLFDRHGIALEAHQQNSLLDISKGYPSVYYYRDNQGFYLSKSYQEHLIELENAVNTTPELFYDDDMIIDRFSYYLIINQLFSVINRMGVDKLIDEKTLLALCIQKLHTLQHKMTGVGKQFIHSLLTRKDLPCKGNLLTRIDDVDELQADLELAIYTQIKNPLAALNSTPPKTDLPTPSKREVQLEYA